MTSVEPTAVDVSENRIKLSWADDTAHELPARLLRAACNCAQCVSEITGERMIDLDKTPNSIKITSAEPTGNYAISIKFSDFHSTGIYTYEYLRQLGEGRRTRSK